MSTDGGALLSLFKGQLEKECEALAKKHKITSRSKSLAWWYFSRLHGLDDDEIKNVICDGGGDLGIDAIWIDRTTVVRFYQFKNVEDADRGLAAGEVDKTISGLKV